MNILNPNTVLYISYFIILVFVAQLFFLVKYRQKKQAIQLHETKVIALMNDILIAISDSTFNIENDLLSIQEKVKNSTHEMGEIYDTIHNTPKNSSQKNNVIKFESTISKTLQLDDQISQLVNHNLGVVNAHRGTLSFCICALHVLSTSEIDHKTLESMSILIRERLADFQLYPKHSPVMATQDEQGQIELF